MTAKDLSRDKYILYGLGYAAIVLIVMYYISKKKEKQLQP